MICICFSSNMNIIINHNIRFTFTFRGFFASSKETYTDTFTPSAEWMSRSVNQTASSSGAVRVRRLAQGHLDTLGARSSRGIILATFQLPVNLLYLLCYCCPNQLYIPICHYILYPLLSLPLTSVSDLPTRRPLSHCPLCQSVGCAHLDPHGRCGGLLSLCWGRGGPDAVLWQQLRAHLHHRRPTVWIPV